MKPYKKYFYYDNLLSINTSEFLLENVLHPEKYLKLLQNFLERKGKSIIGRKDNAKFFCGYLSRIFKKYNILFVLDTTVSKVQGDEYKLGFTESGYNGGNKNDINIFCNENIIKAQINKKFYDLFSKYLLKLLGHELIHRIQALNVEDIKLKRMIYQQINPNVDLAGYLSNKYEIMARAWQIVEEFRFYGYDDQKIKNVLYDRYEPSISISLFYYRNLFKTNTDTMKLLYKYIYLYVVDDTGEN